jgi:hypothetical protein
VRALAALAPGSDAHGFLRTRLVRERNRVADALASASEHIELMLADLAPAAR